MAPGILPDISLEAIDDKSKADGLAKTLALVQASWLILDSISRWAQSLVVTQLELNAFAHAICALMIYCLWWHKPLDVNEPTIIAAEPIHSLAAIGWVCSHDATTGKRECDDVAWLDRGSTSYPGVATESGMVSSSTVFCLNLKLSYTKGNALCKRFLAKNKIEPKMPFYVLPRGMAISKLQDSTAVHIAATDPQFHRRWAMAWQFRQLYPMVFISLPVRQKQFQRRLRFASPCLLGYTPYSVDLVSCTDSNNWTCSTPLAREFIGNKDITLTDLDKRTSFVILSLSALAYGGLHGSAWRDSFPTSIELSLWRVSSVYMAASGVAFVAGSIWARNQVFKVDVYFMNERRLKQQSFIVFMDKALTGFFLAIFFPSVILFCLGYFFVRIFLVVEAFLALRALPSSAYSTPNWTRLLVHL